MSDDVRWREAHDRACRHRGQVHDARGQGHEETHGDNDLDEAHTQPSITMRSDATSGTHTGREPDNPRGMPPV